MNRFFHLDFETYSKAQLVGPKTVGAYRYANDESTEILIFAIREGDGKIHTWDKINGGDKALEMFREAVFNNCIIYAHNAQFEAAICKYVLFRQLGIDAPKLTQWRCTAAMARRAAIPSSLSQCGAFLELGDDFAKDKEGSRLIQMFSCPKRPTKTDARTRIFGEDEPEEFQKFVDYCRQDVVAETAIHKKLKAFELKGEVLASFQFDMEMNDYGIPVNVEALQKYKGMVSIFEKRTSGIFTDMVGLRHTQGKKILPWMQERGYPFDNLQAANVEKVLESGLSGWQVHGHGEVEMTQEAFNALSVRAKVSFAAAKKVDKMLDCVCDDGRVRGCLLWSGAERSHRWAGRLIQPQNFKRSTKDSVNSYNMICKLIGDDSTEMLQMVEMLYEDFLKLVACSIRHFIQPKGGEFLQADYSNVEGRGAPWLCDGEDKLNIFRRGEPVYELQASKIFSCPVEQVIAEDNAGDGEKRFLGKQAELGCNYQMGWPKFRGTCENYKYKPSQNMVDAYAPTYRKKIARALQCFHNAETYESSGIRVYSKPANPKKATLKKQLTELKKRAICWEQMDDETIFLLEVEALRKGGTKRYIKDIEPTPAEWVDLTYDDLARKAVKQWRNSNPEVVKAWKSLDVAAKNALRNPGTLQHGTSKISFAVTKKPGFQALILKLPSGHNLIYPKAKLVWKCEDKNKPVDMNDNFNTEIQFWGIMPGTKQWGWCNTYGGKLLENATQAICGDLMGFGAVVAQKAGVKAVMLVHDEMIAKKEKHTHEQLCDFLCVLPTWAKGFPLEAAGNTIPFYMKT